MKLINAAVVVLIFAICGYNYYTNLQLSAKVARLQVITESNRRPNATASLHPNMSIIASKHMAAAKRALESSDVTKAQTEIELSARSLTGAIDEQHAEMGKRMYELENQLREVRSQSETIMSVIRHRTGTAH